MCLQAQVFTADSMRAPSQAADPALYIYLSFQPARTRPKLLERCWGALSEGKGKRKREKTFVGIILSICFMGICNSVSEFSMHVCKRDNLFTIVLVGRRISVRLHWKYSLLEHSDFCLPPSSTSLVHLIKKQKLSDFSNDSHTMYEEQLKNGWPVKTPWDL